MTSFAHPVERELARLLDQHGVAWEYEPHTFVLERDGDGNVREAFTPDFFLPELGVYLECTVMRQALTTSKQRKARKVRERTGAIVEILFRRDFDRLARRWGLTSLSAATYGRDVSEVGDSGIDSQSMDERPVMSAEAGYRVDVDRLSSTAAIVAVLGDADLYSAPDLRDRLDTLISEGVHRIVLDLSQTTFIDSMALGVFLGAKKRLAALGGELDVVVSSSDIRRIFEITMLDRVFDLHSSRAEAIPGADGAR